MIIVIIIDLTGYKMLSLILLSRLTKNMLKGPKSRAILASSKQFTTNYGLKHEDESSPLLFNKLLEHVVLQVQEQNIGLKLEGGSGYIAFKVRIKRSTNRASSLMNISIHKLVRRRHY